jgi:hypothetical protein
MDITFPGRPMAFDCETCPVRGRHCDDCVVATFLGLPTVPTRAVPETGRPLSDPEGPEVAEGVPGLELVAEERATVRRLVAAGLLAPEDAAGLRAEVVADPWQWQTG